MNRDALDQVLRNLYAERQAPRPAPPNPDTPEACARRVRLMVEEFAEWESRHRGQSGRHLKAVAA